MEIKVDKKKIIREFNEGFISFLYDHFENSPRGIVEDFERPIKLINEKFLFFYIQIQLFVGCLQRNEEDPDLVLNSFQEAFDSFQFLREKKIFSGEGFASFLDFDKGDDCTVSIDLFSHRYGNNSHYEVIRYYPIGDYIQKILLQEEEVKIEAYRDKLLELIDDPEKKKEARNILVDILDEQYSYASSQQNY